ncbi:MAG: twin transmembrane helix small protein [Alphaproteobacteria bacterium]|jgi:hypothetical protein|nr:twin transmembrane helix small protein [Alphaproteobacteria bacterium]MBP9878021.1 twin transmembrane helix small protein [Alphaproteobacteria bacterium]
MNSVVAIVLVFALVAVFATLVLGLINMLRGDSKEQSARSNQLMRWRVVLQGVAIALFLLLMFLSNKH